MFEFFVDCYNVQANHSLKIRVIILVNKSLYLHVKNSVAFFTVITKLILLHAHSIVHRKINFNDYR